MPDILSLLIIATTVAGLGWYAWTLTGSYQRSRKSALLEKLRSSNRYRGITIRNGNCPAVRHLTGNFYRFEDAPELPVEGCKKLRCSCVYAGINNRRYEESRTGKDLRSEVRFEADSSERRQENDRRKDNNIKWQD
jgi:hypothetical protein